MPVTLTDLPEEALLYMLSAMDMYALACITCTNANLRATCISYAWPALAAREAGVAGVRPKAGAGLQSASAWLRLVRSIRDYSAARTLHVSVQLARTDSVQALALRFAVSPHAILRTNALLNETHLASRARLYVPLTSDENVQAVTGRKAATLVPAVVRDTTLAGRHFLVVRFCHPAPAQMTIAARRADELKALVVRAFARGFDASEETARFYLDEAHFDFAAARQALLEEREWTGTQ